MSIPEVPEFPVLPASSNVLCAQHWMIAAGTAALTGPQPEELDAAAAGNRTNISEIWAVLLKSSQQ